MFNPLDLFLSWAAKKGFDSVYGKVVTWFRRESPKGVLIIGPGGVGKTTLAHFLAGTDGENQATGEYIESAGTDEFKLADNLAVQIIVPPGQSRRRPATWEVLLDDVKKGRFRGIILIAAYGY